MKILYRPPSYTAMALLVLLAIPIFVLNLWIMQKGATSKVFQPPGVWWIAVATVWTLATLRSLLKARWVGFWSFLGLMAAMLLGNAALLVSTKNYALAFYALFLLILAAMYLLQLYKNLGEPYYDSGQGWFEGAPRFLPHIEGVLEVGSKSLPVRFSRLGVDGCFAFADAKVEPKAERRGKLAMKLDTLQLKCDVELVSRTKDGLGRGLRFSASTADERKEIRDFIDRVRSAGYVA